MQLNTTLKPFHADYHCEHYKEDKYSIAVCLFDQEIFRTEPFYGYPDEYTLENFADAAQEILGELIAERLAAKVKYGQFGGIPSIG